MNVSVQEMQAHAARGDVTYTNQSAIRNRPVSDRLNSVLQQAARQVGIDEVRVFSGGQPSKGRRTGSHRHDNGNAADLNLIVGGRALDFQNPADLPKIQAFVSAAHQLGATGIGAGTDYMGSKALHIGFGPSSVWGAGGRTANAPGWLNAAVNAPGGPVMSYAAEAASPVNAIVNQAVNTSPRLPTPQPNPYADWMRRTEAGTPPAPLGAGGPQSLNAHALFGRLGNPQPPTGTTAQDILQNAMKPPPGLPAMPQMGFAPPAGQATGPRGGQPVEYAPPMPPAPRPLPMMKRERGFDPFQGPGPVTGPYSILNDYTPASMFMFGQPNIPMQPAGNGFQPFGGLFSRLFGG